MARDFLIDSMNSAKLDVRMTIEGKDFAMIEDFVQTLVNLMIDAGTDETIKHLKDSCEKQQVEKKLSNILISRKSITDYTQLLRSTILPGFVTISRRILFKRFSMQFRAMTANAKRRAQNYIPEHITLHTQKRPSLKKKSGDSFLKQLTYFEKFNTAKFY